MFRRRRRRAQSDFSEELQAHLELEADRLQAEGPSEREAYRQARRNLGNLSIAEERFYEGARWLWLEQLKLDIRPALRRLGKAPVFAIPAILTPDELYRLGKQSHCCVWGDTTKGTNSRSSRTNCISTSRDHTPGFAELEAFDGGGILLGVRREGKAEAAEFVSGNDFAIFGVKAYAGRMLTGSDDHPERLRSR